MGHLRGGLIGQVDQDTLGQADVEEVAYATDLVSEGLGQDALHLGHHLSDHLEDPLGNPVARNDKARSLLLLIRARRVQVCVDWERGKLRV